MIDHEIDAKRIRCGAYAQNKATTNKKMQTQQKKHPSDEAQNGNIHIEDLLGSPDAKQKSAKKQAPTVTG